MKYIFLFVIFFSKFSVAGDSFGEKIKNINQPIRLSKALSTFEKIKGSEITIEGIVEKVCAKKGCWMTLKSNKETIRVTFKDYGFFVPVKFQNKPILAQGKLYQKVEEPELRQHYLEDEGATKKQIAEANKSILTYHFVADGVMLK